MTAGVASRPPLVSVVIPTFNHNHYIGEALVSVLAQRVEDLELIVVDDGSDTPVEPLVRGKAPNATVVRQVNAGPSAARNAGVGRAEGSFVACLDADDLWTSGALERLLKGFRDAPGAAVVQGNVRNFLTPNDAPSFNGARIGQPFQGFSVGALLARREVLLDGGLFDESLRLSEDVDLFIRWVEQRRARLVIPDVVLHHRKYLARSQSASIAKAVSPGGTTADECRLWMERLHRSMARRRSNATPALLQNGRAATPAVSVILTVRNGMPHLQEAVAAIRQQTLSPHEIVAVVGRSNDGTLEYLRSEPGIRVLEQSDVGLAAARNAALEAAKCPLLAFCDHDDLWHPAKLEKQVAVVSQFSAPGACIVNFKEFSKADSTEPTADLLRDVPTLAWTPSALLAHREVFRAVGPFDPTLGLGCDVDWFRRLRQLDIPCGVAGRALLRKRRHASNLSHDPKTNRAAMFKMLRKARRELKARPLSGALGHHPN
jgi:glycosyltransferase involved in cell wall biosynthesis